MYESLQTQTMDKITYYCQKCRAANDSGETDCRVCGTRLMLIVFPPSIRHEEGKMPSYYEDHLLERVSLLELRLAQVTEQMAAAYEFIHREVGSFQKDHVLLRSFFETLEKVNPNLSELLSREYLELHQVKEAEKRARNSIERELEEILKAHDAKQTELFEHLIREAIRLVSENEEKQAFRTFESAILLSPRNLPFRVFVGKYQFKAEKFAEARENLEAAFEFAAHDPRVLTILGACLADEGETERARKLLSVLATNPRAKVCVNLIWGLLAASAENWLESLAAFKVCSASLELAEIDYLIGCAYFELGRRRSALKYLSKALASDPNFADALFMKSMVYAQLKNAEMVLESRRAAFELKEAGAQCLEFMKGRDIFEPGKALPFMHFSGKNKRLLTGGSVRLSKLFKEQVLLAID